MNLFAGVYFIAPALHPTGTLRYLLPSPLACSVAAVLVCALTAGALNASLRSFLIGSAAASVAFVAMAVLIGWIMTNPKGTPGLVPSFGRFLLESVSSVSAVAQIIALFLIVPTLAAVGWSVGRLVRGGFDRWATHAGQQRPVA